MFHIPCFVDFNSIISLTDAFVLINTAMSDGTATEGEGVGSLQVCVIVTGGSATQIQNLIVPLIVVANTAGMLNMC